MASGDRVGMEDLPVSFQNGGLNSTPRNIREDMEKNLILKMLQSTSYNRSKVAQLLNMSRKTLYNKMERYGINA
jgi:two-component system response regulator HydG